jgi:dihydroflavonol-4-reductase
MSELSPFTEGDLSFWRERQVAVTGATGFVGSHVALALVAVGARVTALVRPTSDASRLRNAGVRCVVAPLEDPRALAAACIGMEIVFHVAGAVDFAGDWAAVRCANVAGTRHVLEGARAAGVRRVVYTSSIVAVGASKKPTPLDEKASWNLERYGVPYVTTKREAEVLALGASGPGLEVVAVNPACVIGPDDFTSSEFGTLCKRFWRGRLPFHFGGGHNYVDVRDVAWGHLLAARLGRPGERYLLPGHNRSSTAFFADLARAAGRVIPRLRLPDRLGVLIASIEERFRNRLRRRPGHRPYLTTAQARLLGLYFYYDGAKARRELGYEPRPLTRTLADCHAFWTGRPSSPIQGGVPCSTAALTGPARASA